MIKKTIFALTLTALSMTALQAHEKHPPMMEDRPMLFQVDHLKKKLDLSPEQVTKIEAINKTRQDKNKTSMDQLKPLHEQLKTLSDAPTPDYVKIKQTLDKMATPKADMYINMIQYKKDIQGILTPEQREKLEKKRHKKYNKACDCSNAKKKNQRY